MERDLWTCPECERRFVNKNQSHSCGRFTVEEHLKNKTEHALLLYYKFVENLEAIGTFTYAPTRTRIGFQARMIFAAINRIGSKHINGHLILRKTRKGSSFYRVELGVIHHFRIVDAEDFDDDFIGFMKEAYSVGLQEREPTPPAR